MVSWSFVIITLQVTLVWSQDSRFKGTPPNTGDWLNPDDYFSVKADKNDVGENNSNDGQECHEKLKILLHKYSECEKSLQGSYNKEDINEREVQEEKTNRELSSELSMHCQDGSKGYLQRFVILLLEVSNLISGEISKETSAEIKFSISDEQLMVLRQFAKEGSTKEVPLRKLDEILAAVLVKPLFNLPSLESLWNKLPKITIDSFFFSAFIPALCFLFFWVKTQSVRKSFVLLTPVLFFTTYIITAHRMFEEAHFKQYEEIKRYPDALNVCQQKRFNGFSAQFFRSWFGTGNSDCLKALKAHHIDPNLHITSFKVITKMFGESMAEIMKSFGSGFIGLFGEFEELGYLTQVWVFPCGCVLLFFLFSLLSIVLTGGSIRLPYFLGSLSFGSSREKKTTSTGRFPSDVSTDTASLSGPITYNFINYRNESLQDIVRTVSGLPGSLPNAATQPADILHSAASTSSPIGHSFHHQPEAGDGSSHVVQDNLNSGHSVLSNRAPHKPGVGRKFNKQFSHLEARYKAGHKLNGILNLKTRKMSL